MINTVKAVVNVPIPSPNEMELGGPFTEELLVTRCVSCGEHGSGMTRDRGVPFCQRCIDHGTLNPVWEDWDDLGGGD